MQIVLFGRIILPFLMNVKQLAVDFLSFQISEASEGLFAVRKSEMLRVESYFATRRVKSERVESEDVVGGKAAIVYS